MRRVVWFTCIARGVVLTFDKTHTVEAWARQKPMYLAYAFLFVHAFVNYLGLDPNFTKGDLVDILSAALSVLAVLFVVLMTKTLVDLEGANSLLTVPMFLYFFDESILRERGFHVVSFADLTQYILVDRAKKIEMKAKPSDGVELKFSWNEIHALTPSETPRRTTLIDGVRVAYFLRRYKNVKH